MGWDTRGKMSKRMPKDNMTQSGGKRKMRMSGHPGKEPEGLLGLEICGGERVHGLIL